MPEMKASPFRRRRRAGETFAERGRARRGSGAWLRASPPLPRGRAEATSACSQHHHHHGSEENQAAGSTTTPTWSTPPTAASTRSPLAPAFALADLERKRVGVVGYSSVVASRGPLARLLLHRRRPRRGGRPGRLQRVDAPRGGRRGARHPRRLFHRPADAGARPMAVGHALDSGSGPRTAPAAACASCADSEGPTRSSAWNPGPSGRLKAQSVSLCWSFSYEPFLERNRLMLTVGDLLLLLLPHRGPF